MNNLFVFKMQTVPQKNKKLLSFDSEEEDNGEDEKVPAHKGMSAHDFLNDPRLKKQVVISPEELNNLEQAPINKEPKEEADLPKHRVVRTKTGQIEVQFFEEVCQPKLENNEDGFGDTSDFKKEQRDSERSQGDSENSQSESEDPEYSTKEEKELLVRQKQLEEYEKMKIDFLRFKKDKEGSLRQETKRAEEESLKAMSLVEAKRQMFLKKGKIKEKESNKLRKLESFRTKINSEAVRENEDAWLGNSLKFHVDSANAFSHSDLKNAVDERTKNEKRLLEKRFSEGETTQNDEGRKPSRMISEKMLLSLGLK